MEQGGFKPSWERLDNATSLQLWFLTIDPALAQFKRESH